VPVNLKHPKDISIQDFTYHLPEEKIAQYPLPERDASKLLIYKNGEIKEDVFLHIDSFLEKDSLLVFNTTRVVSARLNFLNDKGQPIEIFCLEPNSQGLELTQAMSQKSSIRWNCLVGNLRRWKEKELKLSKGKVILKASIAEQKEQYVEIDFAWEPSGLSFSEVLEETGNIPIPPYLKRESEKIDRQRYQTIYANVKGSVAAPTAGLHFTDRVLKKLHEKEISSLNVTLHVGAGTFKPVKSDTMAGHSMHAEWIDVEIKTIRDLRDNLQKTIIPVGTTSLRTIETLYWMGLKAHFNPESSLHDLELKQWEVYEITDKPLPPAQALNGLLKWMENRSVERLVCHTQLMIAPPYELKIAKGTITNFHQPQSTLLLLISVITGSRWKDIYDYALFHNFRFLSYGDSSLLLK
jgi:S-adenosylmethionine:tRNA ribosyltransferase-isomerase